MFQMIEISPKVFRLVISFQAEEEKKTNQIKSDDGFENQVKTTQ